MVRLSSCSSPVASGKVMRGTDLDQGHVGPGGDSRVPSDDLGPLFLHAPPYPGGAGSLRILCPFILTRHGALIHEERTPEDEGLLSPMISPHPGRLDLRKRTGSMLELIEKDGDPRICGEMAG